MTMIYMQSTIELMGSQNARETRELIATGIVKDLNGFAYLVIEDNKK